MTSATRTTKPTNTIKLASTKDEIEACYQIRLEVFSVEQGFPVDTEIDEYDPISRHFLLSVTEPSPPDTSFASYLPIPTLKPEPFPTSTPIGTIRWTPSIGKVGRVTVLKDYRQFGFGRVLMEELEKYIVEKEDLEAMKDITRVEGGKMIVRVKLNSQMPVLAFYERFGYIKEGGIFDEEGAPHQKMVKDIITHW